jgi:thiamine kinase-like enzyme
MTADSSEIQAAKRVAGLPIWTGAVRPTRLAGGITNLNFRVADGGHTYVVRVGDDIPVHHILRFNEAAASRAAFEAGISPEVVHTEPGVLVIRFVEGVTLTAADVRDPVRLGRIATVLGNVHREMPRHLRGPLLAFWVFHVIRDYAHALREKGSRYAPLLGGLLATADELEKAVGPVTLVFGHNDLLPANFIDDGRRIWLIDWDYAGWNSPLFDLANLASNAELEPDGERLVLTSYFGQAPDAALMASYTAMKCASLLRETLWGMVSEITSHLDFDYAGYVREYLARFERAESLRRETMP